MKVIDLAGTVWKKEVFLLFLVQNLEIQKKQNIFGT